MTECHGQKLFFSPLGRKQVGADFSGGTLTSDAGGLLLREAERRLGLVESLARCLEDPRDPAKVRHEQKTMLAQRIFGIALGYEDLNDHDRLRHDPLFSLLAEKRPSSAEPLASSPTLCRLENRVDRGALWRMSEALLDRFLSSYSKPPRRLVLDFDATDDPVHGQQEGRFFHGYYDGYCFLPLYVFCEGRLLVSYLRPSGIDAAWHSRGVLKLLVERIRSKWPGVEIVVRADSGFCRWRLMRWCDRNEVSYVLGLARNSVLERKASRLLRKAERDFETSGTKQRLFGEFVYGAATWERRRRVIVKAERLEKGPNLRFVVTNLAGLSPEQIYDGLYVGRGEMENRIKEQQLGLFADRTSCHRFLSNQFRLLLASAAFVLIEHLRRVGLRGSELARAQVGSIRCKLLKIGARVAVSCRRIVLHLSGAFPLRELFARALARLLPSSALHLASP